MERNCRYIERFGQKIIIQIVISASFADVRGHPDRMQDEIELAAEMLHGLLDQVLQIGYAGGVGRYDDGAARLGQLTRDRVFVQGSENQPLLSFQQIIRHLYSLLIGAKVVKYVELQKGDYCGTKM